MELLRLHEAATLVGVSYPTLKQWIYNGKIKSQRVVLTIARYESGR